jgi:hypothetical protein
MELSSYPAQSLTFSGLGAEGRTAGAAAEALAAALNLWAAAHPGHHLLHLAVAPTPATSGAGLAAILVHTAGSELSVALAEEVTAAIESAETEPALAEFERILGEGTSRS